MPEELNILKLYHGSNEAIKVPDISKGRNPLDFGKGFYLTSSREQARQWAIKKANRLNAGLPVINVFAFDNRHDFSPLSVKIFESPNEEWLDFVVANRNEAYQGLQFDIIIVPVADDSVIRTIRFYMQGIYDKQETLKRFKVDTLDNQYLFATLRSLALLQFEKTEVA